MSFWTDDIDEFFADFAISVTLDPGGTGEVDIDAIFDEPQRIIDLQTGEVVNASPALTCKTSDVSGVTRRSTVEIDSVTYYVNEILNDGTGITQLILSGD